MDLRAIDALVAEHVMGYEPWPEQRFNERAFKAPMVLPHQTPKPCEAPHYSTDIASAWKVVESLYEFEFIIEQKGTGWKAHFDSSWAGAETAPLAICLAALTAKNIILP